MNRKIKIGVLGAGRGETMMQYCKLADNAELVAVCDAFEHTLQNVKKRLNDDNITYYQDFDKFLEHDMDAVVLANFATEHAPFAIRCMEKGLHVLSEVLPVQTMKEAVELVEAVERTGKIYAYAENYCYMPAPREMRRLMREGKLGTFEYGEGEYMHNCESGWAGYSQGNPNHWRNTMYATFYCTHSIGPLIHISGLRPVSVSAFELPFNDRMMRMGAKSGHAAVEIVTLENGAVIKSLHGVGCSKNSIWYSVYASEGRMESAREDALLDDIQQIYVNPTENNPHHFESSYKPTDEHSETASELGHGGSDFYTMYHFVEKIKGNPDADIVDVYEALDMFLPGILGYQSILKGNLPMEIPNFRNKAAREPYRNDTACTSPEVAGDMLLPSYSKGNPEIPQEIYDGLKEQWLKSIEKHPQQLKMILFPTKKPPVSLPEGYKVVKYSGLEEEQDAWVEICKDGLLCDDAGREAFTDIIAKQPNINLDTDVFFIKHDGEKVATITVINNYQDSGMGYVHMVSVKTSERGKGLGNALNAIAERKLWNDRCRMAYLTTDDFRKAACKSYLAAGFYPVNCDDDMPERWTAIIEELGIDSVQMLTESGAPDIVLKARK